MTITWLTQMAALPNNPALIQKFIAQLSPDVQQAYLNNDQAFILNALNSKPQPDRNTVFTLA